MIGPGRAKAIFFTGRRVLADEAHDLGVFNEVVPFDQLADRARELTTTIAAGAPLALRFMKENLNRAVVSDLKACLDMEADRTVRCTRTEDHLEGVNAFLSKRKPVFTGK